jgi:O-succinylbenzoic acid--CoA ligase
VRDLKVVDASNVSAVLDGLRAALAGDGPAILPYGGAPREVPVGLPDTVERRVALVVETSGSTGRPKRVALSADALLASAAASTTALDASGQWLLALPTHYIAGANVLVRSLAAQTEPVVMAEALTDAPFTAQGFLAATDRLDDPTRLVSLERDLWRLRL